VSKSQRLFAQGRRKIGKFLGPPPSSPKPLVRAASFPFVSGDTFRLTAEVRLEETEITRVPALASSVIFASGAEALSENFKSSLSRAVNLVTDPARARLIIHNGDSVPSEVLLGELKGLVEEVYCVNVLDGDHGVFPIPIGLENVSLGKNGRLNYYLDALEKPSSVEDRPRPVLSSFHVSTQPEIRGRVAEILSQSRHGHEVNFRKSLEYRLEVQRSQFVISPPGNGPDCHRTWEALYLGAVPVVLEGYLAKSLVRDLPVLEVSSYEDFCSYSNAELREIYLDLRSKGIEKALGSYWISKVLR
jgi:hypothetical protein